MKPARRSSQCWATTFRFRQKTRGAKKLRLRQSSRQARLLIRVTWEVDQSTRDAARGIAEAVLVARGFTVAGARWRGRLGGFACTVELTEAFPFVLPKIRLDRSLHREIIAHVDAK